MIAPSETMIYREQLSETSVDVLELVSIGQTNSQISRQLSITGDNVDSFKNELRTVFRTPSLSRAVSFAIQKGLLEIEPKPDDQIINSLSPIDCKLLEYYGRGGTNCSLQKTTRISKKSIEWQHDRLLEKIKAWSRPHGIRRAFELEVVTVKFSEGVN